MGYQKLSAKLDAERVARIISKIQELKAELDFVINLSNEERKTLRKVAEKRQGYVNDVLIAVKANPKTIPGVLDTEDYYYRAKLYLDLAEINMHIQPVMEGISDTMMVAGNEAITLTDQCYGFLKQPARGNSNLTDTVSKLSKHFASRSKPAEPEDKQPTDL
ncbi:hypothetical protein [Sporocytophaga myxococcoides]|uniref:hypothetical protein n=1 Tax=Sporocytophaga myxococcoides TaxID=153721 RepID=UPI00040490B4|nr:hypothetical protein [Sporocytophaga myxococcoides]